MGMHTKAGVGDKVSFKIERAPTPPPKKSLLKKMKNKAVQLISVFCSKDNGSDDDEEEDDDDEYDSIKRDPFVGLFFMARK